MKRLFALTILAAGLLAGGLHAQNQDSAPRPGGVFGANGRWWKSASAAEKIGYVLGYDNTVSLLFYTLGVTHLPFEQFKHFQAVYLSKLTMTERATALDRFYETPENGLIEVVLAIGVINERANGTDESKVQKMIEDPRAGATK
jgi:hypothetical protein